MEYIKWFLRYIDEETPVLLFYEVDIGEERYATRMIEVFQNRKMKKVIEEGFPFVTEAPVPLMDEINTESDWFACTITREEFEELYDSGEERYHGAITFPIEN